MKLNFHTIGAGRPLLILHGLLGSLDNWMPHAQLLSDEFQVFLLDLRNHGRSPHADEFNYDLLAGDVVDFLHEQKIQRARVLGHSMGGKIAMRLAQLHPDLIERLLVLDMAPRAYAPRYAEILHTMHELDLSNFQHRSDVDVALQAVAPDKNIRQFLLKNIGRNAAGQMHWKPNVASLRANYQSVRAALPTEVTFSGPTLFIRGGRSDYIRPEDETLIQTLFPAAEIATIATASHWVHAEAPEEFLRLTRRFFTSA